jgi:hypothetical protein
MYKNIILHWTGGSYTPSPVDISHYHYCIDGDGELHIGNYTPEDNLDCTDGKYAAHCGGGNTGRIGIAICCRKDKQTQPTQKQVEAMCKLAAQCCIAYGIKTQSCITHAEFGQQNPKTSSKGKIDINYLAHAKLYGVKNVGDYLRNKINWYYKRILGK